MWYVITLDPINSYKKISTRLGVSDAVRNKVKKGNLHRDGTERELKGWLLKTGTNKMGIGEVK